MLQLLSEDSYLLEGLQSADKKCTQKQSYTRSTATAEESRDVLRQFKYYGRFWLSYWQEALLMQRNHVSTLSVEIV